MATLLIVEEDPVEQKEYHEEFAADGHEIYGAEDANDALELFESKNPDLVIVDPHLGQFLQDYKGIWVLEKMKKARPDCLVVIYAAHDYFERDHRYQLADLNLEQCEDHSCLHEAVDKLLEEKEAAATETAADAGSHQAGS